jgi:hypothetical protein
LAHFLVFTGIPKSKMDPVACASGTPTLLKEAGVKDVKINRCLGAKPDEKKFYMEFEAPSKEILAKALEKIEFPVESIKEVTEVKM